MEIGADPDDSCDVSFTARPAAASDRMTGRTQTLTAPTRGVRVPVEQSPCRSACLTFL